MFLSHQRRAATVAALVAPSMLLLGAGAAEGHSARHGMPLTDLRPLVADATDGGSGSVGMHQTPRGTVVLLRLDGLDPSVAGHTFGAHVHTGPCVAGDGASAGPHYNHDVALGDPTPEVSAETEVWLDVTVRPGGGATSVAVVPFVIAPDAARSVVIHAVHTDPTTGLAGPRLACLPLDQ